MSDTAFVLIVEDERAHGEAIAEALARSTFACNVVDSGPAAIESVPHRTPDGVITDYKLGGGVTGMDVLREAKKKNPDTEVILITAYGSEALAREVLSQDSEFRAYDYLIKPVDIDVLRDKVNRAAKQALAARDARLLKEQVDQAFEFSFRIISSESFLPETKP